jgi:arylsulfatase A-like enzyme
MDVTRRAFLGKGAAALSAFAAGCGENGSSTGSQSPNVLWIVNDASRAKNYSCYGYARRTSPNLERIAARGVIFERAYSQYFWTVPSVCSYMTSRLFPDLLLDPSFFTESIYPTGIPDATLAPAVFRRAGYETMMLSANTAYVRRDTWFGRSFKHAQHVPGDDYQRRHENDRSFLKGSFQNANDRILTWLQMRRGSSTPFFLYVHALETHSPYLVPPQSPFNDWIDESYTGIFRNFSPSPGYGNPVSPEDMRQLTGMYDGCIRYSDYCLGALFDGLDEMGLLDSTLVVYTSDHGEALFEDGKTGEHPAMTAGYDESRRVPLILTGPGVPKGKRVQHPVELMDIAPTLYTLCGIAPKAEMDGVSLSPLWSESTASYAKDITRTCAGMVGSTSLARLVLSNDDYVYDWENGTVNGQLQSLMTSLKDWKRNPIDDRAGAAIFEKHIHDTALPHAEKSLHTQKQKIVAFYAGHFKYWQKEHSKHVHIAYSAQDTRKNSNLWTAANLNGAYPLLSYNASEAGSAPPPMSLSFTGFHFVGKHDLLLEFQAAPAGKPEDAAKMDLSFGCPGAAPMEATLSMEGTMTETGWRLEKVGTIDFQSPQGFRLSFDVPPGYGFRLCRLLLMPEKASVPLDELSRHLGRGDMIDTEALKERQESLEALGYLG